MAEGKFINVGINYSAMCEQFRVDAMNHMHQFASERKQAFSRKEVYDFIASLRIALCSASSVGEIEMIRVSLGEEAERIFAVLNREQGS